MARLRGLRDTTSAGLRNTANTISERAADIDQKDRARLAKTPYLMTVMRFMGFIVTALGMYSTSTAIQNFNRKKEGDKTTEEKRENIANIVFLVFYLIFALCLMYEAYSSLVKN